MDNIKLIPIVPQWMDIAFQELGEEEILGAEDNPRIVEYLSVVGISAGDETAWCSAFVNWVLKTAEFKYTGEPNARSWLHYGYEISEPKLGDIVVLWRERIDSWKGHVGFLVGHRAGNIYLLGGNQENMVTISPYPFERILGVRRPKINQIVERRIHNE